MASSPQSQGPRYRIGIDLGTTNCAIASLDLAHPHPAPKTVPVPQLAEADRITSRSGLPSFLYRIPPSASPPPSPWLAGQHWIPGIFARQQQAKQPARVVHSAKSWLANHHVRPADRLLPYQSSDVSSTEKISPIQASAHFLAHLRRAWEAFVAPTDPDAAFTDQPLTITVPASFDAAAQQATREAASLAGFKPEHTRLLEEPQAALFHQLSEASGSEDSPLAALQPGQQVLVVDIGGGTSDFSLFRIRERKEASTVAFERIAVSEHILLGGDNIDLATAHLLESVLLPDGGEISGSSWEVLLERARAIKEQALGDKGAGAPGTDPLPFAIPGTGSGLLGNTLSGQIDPAAVRECLLEGFFPPCHRTEPVYRDRSALREWGLPYASDFAVTRYLAEFLKNQPPVDAVLFNGGTLIPCLFRERLLDVIASWQQDHRPAEIPNPQPDLAVARGAALYGVPETGLRPPIKANAAQAVFLELEAPPEATSSPPWLCVLPRGTPPDTPVTVTHPQLAVRVNARVRFRAHQSHLSDAQAGLSEPADSASSVSLPPLVAEISAQQSESTGRIPVAIESRLNQLGRLEIKLIALHQPEPAEWSLSFNLRQNDPAPAETAEVNRHSPAAPADLSLSTEQDQRIQGVLAKAFTGSGRSEKPAAKGLLRQLAAITGRAQADWPLHFARSLADSLLEIPMPDPAEDSVRAAVYCHLLGFFLRPGIGQAEDPERMERVWQGLGQSLPPAKPRQSHLQALLLWRRLAAGLTAPRQEHLYQAIATAAVSPKTTSEEHIRLIGSLELLPMEHKTEWCRRCLDSITANDRHSPAYVQALERLLTRTPFHAPAKAVLPPDFVKEAFQKLQGLDWQNPLLHHLPRTFLSAARIVEDPNHNLPPRLQRRIIARLRKAGLPASRLAPLQEYRPLTRSDYANLYQESLPAGLLLQQG